MKTFSALCTVAALYCITAGAQASAVGDSIMHIQQPDSLVQNISSACDSIPAETIVPAMKPDFKSSDTATRDNPRPDPRTRAERRACRARDFSFGLDSLVATQSFAFYPTTMQAAPKGDMRMIYAEFYYVYISPVDLEVHMPVERGVTQYVSMLNFDTDSIGGYTATKHQTQWFISFSAAYDGQNYDFEIVISTVTGEAVLTIQGPATAMRYIGSIGKRLQEKTPSERRRRNAALTGPIATPAQPAHAAVTARSVPAVRLQSGR